MKLIVLTESISLPTFKEWLKKAGDLNGYLRRYDTDINDYFPDDYVGDVSKEEQFIGILNDRYEDVIDQLMTLPHPVTLYRCIAIRNLNELNKEKLGIYWSDSIQHADCHWGSGEQTYFLRAIISPNQIDFTSTINARMDLSIGDIEQEITLYNNEDILITGIVRSRNGKFVNTKVKGTT